jgi:glyoxylase-like metal-dependent hydrolase (beta-lactamase superfamily II)
MKIKQFVFNSFSENTYILYDETKECIIVDPGCYEEAERNMLVKFIEENKLKVVALLNTHCHIDHVLGNSFVKRTFGVDLIIHKEDIPTLKANEIVAPIYGFSNYETTEADSFLAEGDFVKFGDSALKVVFVPGHASGHIALINKEEKICIGGDVLFQQSIGRTDLPGGDYDTLISSIKNKLFVLADDVTVYCGHGPSTTIGYEKRNNPFCGAGVN